MTVDIAATLASTHPYDVLPDDVRAELAGAIDSVALTAGETLYSVGDPQTHLFLIVTGRIDITDPDGASCPSSAPGTPSASAGLMKDGIAVVTAKAAEDSELLRIPAASFHALMAEHPRVLRFFDRTRPARTRRQDITTIALSELMTRDPLTCLPATPLIEAARKMREIHVSCIIAAEDSVVKGILTTGDITSARWPRGWPSTRLSRRS
jgi:CBS domain-containing protein